MELATLIHQAPSTICIFAQAQVCGCVSHKFNQLKCTSVFENCICKSIYQHAPRQTTGGGPHEYHDIIVKIVNFVVLSL